MPARLTQQRVNSRPNAGQRSWYFTSLIAGYVFDPAQVGLAEHNCPFNGNGVLTPPSN